jgi:hypothetical protein
MHHKPFPTRSMYDPPRIRRLPDKRKGRYVKYRPQTPEEWEQLDY